MRRENATLGLLLLCLLVTFAAGMLRLHFASEPLWVDELHTAWVLKSESASELARRAAIGNQTPLYFWLNQICCQVAGFTEFGLRFLSLIASTASVAVGGAIVYRSTKHHLAVLVTMLLISFDSWSVFWGSEARPYALIQLLALLQLWALSEFGHGSHRPSRTHQISLVGLTAALPLVHLSSLFFITGQLLYFAVACLVSRAHTQNTRHALLLLATGLLSIVFAWPVIQWVLIRRSDWDLFNQPLPFLKQISAILIVTSCAIALRLAVSLNRVVKRNDTGTALANSETSQYFLRLLVFSSFFPIGFALICCSANLLSIAAARYVSASLVMFPLIIGILVSQQKFVLRISVATIVAVAIATSPLAWNYLTIGSMGQYRQEDFKSAIQHIRQQQYDLPKLIFLFSNLVEDHRVSESSSPQFIEYLKFPLTGIYSFKQATIEPMPTQSRNRWRPRHLQQVSEHGSAVILARVPRKQLDLIIEELQRIADRQKLKLNIKRQIQPGNRILLVFVTTT